MIPTRALSFSAGSKKARCEKEPPIRMMATGAEEEVVEVGYFGAGQFIPCEELSAGMVGYITASIKNVKETRVGDTVTDRGQSLCTSRCRATRRYMPMVYCGLYPADGAKYPDLRDALEKLQLNDASLQFEPETSIALGFGFRCGFLGLLASGNHPGAAGAGVQSGSGDDGPGRYLPGIQDQRRDDRADEPVQPAGSVGDRAYGGALSSAQRSW